MCTSSADNNRLADLRRWVARRGPVLIRTFLCVLLFGLCGLTVYLIPKTTVIQDAIEFLDTNVFEGKIREWFQPF
jgi:hypothetical protein